jgi:hypothetical protein
MQTMRLSSIDIVQQQRKFGKVILRRLHSLSEALTADDHFRQAGFRILLLENPADRP